MTAPVAPAAPVHKATSISLGTLWRAVRRYSVWSFVFFLLAAGAGAGVWFFLPLPKHTGSVVFQILAVQPYNITPVSDPRGDFSLYRQFQITSIKSNNVLSAALADPTLAATNYLDKARTPNAVATLSNHLKTDFNLGPEFMKLSLEGDNPDEIAAVLKAVTNVYLKDVVNKDKLRRTAKFEQLRRLSDKYLEDLRLNRNRVRDVMKVVGSGDPYAIQIRERFLESQIGSAHTQLAGVIASQRDSEVEVKVSQGVAAQTDLNIPAAILNDLVKNDPEYLTTEKERDLLKKQLNDKGFQNYQPGMKSPKMVEMETRLAQLDKDLAAMPTKLKPKIVERFKDNTAINEQARAEALKNKINLLKQMEKAIGADIDNLLAKKMEYSSKQLELESLRQEIAQTEKTADKIATDIEALRPELDAPSRVSQWEDVAIMPGVEGNRRMKYAAMAGLAVLLAGLGFVQFLDIRNRRVTTPLEVTQSLGLPLLGTLPQVDRIGRDGRVASAQVMTEAINTTRTFLLGAGGRAAVPRTILVTSATSGEAKTSLSTHLAVSMAMAGRRVLLIDADMRRPSVHKVFNVAMTAGLSDYLTGRLMDLPAAIQAGPIPSLDILPAGAWRPEAPAGLTGPLWDRILQHGVGAYDFVLIDSPPVLPVADSLSIARSVDGVLLSVMQDTSRYVSVEAAYNRLSLVGAKILGVIVSNVPSTASYYYYDARYSPRVEAVATAVPPSV